MQECAWAYGIQFVFLICFPSARARGRFGRFAERFTAPEEVSLFFRVPSFARCARRLLRLGRGRLSVFGYVSNTRGALGALLSVSQRPKKFHCFFCAFACSPRASLTARGPRAFILCLGMTLFHIHAHTLWRVSLPSASLCAPEEVSLFLGAFACSPRA